MSLFGEMTKKKLLLDKEFDKNEIIDEILINKDEKCPEWRFFRIDRCPHWDDAISYFDQINGDFLVIYTDVINKEIRLNGNPFAEYKRTVESTYQIVREVYISDQDEHNIPYNGTPNTFRRIWAKSAKELFIKLKKEQE
jgi:hypothetical protein